MQVKKEITDIIKHISLLKQQGHSIAFVPTMGNLHQGHLSLAQTAQKYADKIIFSIFVNPLQFAPNEDFATYPRTLERDLIKLKNIDIDLVYTPYTESLLNDSYVNYTKVTEQQFTNILCAKSRPHFFTGVTTIVAKLFNIVTPDVVVLGEKDFQQYCVINKMVKDLNYPIKIILSPTVRDEHGLALSSRNQYLSPQEKILAARLYKNLQDLRNELYDAKTSYKNLIKKYTKILHQDFRVEYLEILDYDTLCAPEQTPKKLKIFAAAYLGKVRLIDNLTVMLKD